MTDDLPPWAKDDAGNNRHITEWAASLDWQDYLVAELAIRVRRDARQQEKQDEEAHREFIKVFRYVAAMGWLDFSIKFFQALYWQWRFGIPFEDL